MVGAAVIMIARLRSAWPARRRPRATDFVALDRLACDACWRCREACPNGVLGRIEMGPHRHVVIRERDACTGCGACLQACPTGALRRLDEPATGGAL